MTIRPSTVIGNNYVFAACVDYVVRRSVSQHALERGDVVGVGG